MVHLPLWACQSLQSHIQPVEHICVFIVPLALHLCPNRQVGIWGLGPGFSQTHEEAHSAVQEAAFGRSWATQCARHPRALASQLARWALPCAQTSPCLHPPPSCCLWPPLRLEGPPVSSPWHSCQAAYFASLEPWPKLTAQSWASAPFFYH